MRITKKHLKTLCDRLNKVTDSPMTSYTRIDGKPVSNVGNYHISHSYGGVCLHRMSNEGGGIYCPIMNSHVPKRELLNLMYAYLNGLQETK